jgi:hypothetical protein
VSQPISPKLVSSHGEKELPAYVSNGLIGLRVRDIPLHAGMALVSGFAGEHLERRVEAAATAPYPLAGDLAVNGVWMLDMFHQTCDLEQTYDFSAGELMRHFTEFINADVRKEDDVRALARKPGATRRDRRGAVPRRMLEIQSGALEIYRRERLQAILLARIPIGSIRFLGSTLRR